jgi:hypothetical protein
MILSTMSVGSCHDGLCGCVAVVACLSTSLFHCCAASCLALKPQGVSLVLSFTSLLLPSIHLINDREDFAIGKLVSPPQGRLLRPVFLYSIKRHDLRASQKDGYHA